MTWAVFLHFYQPANQYPDILEAVVNQSYRPLVRGFLGLPRVKLSLNINAALTELLLRHGYGDVVEGLKQLAANGRLEFVESAKYHPLLPLLPAAEVERQIVINRRTNRRLLGSAYRPRGFFPPEMAYTPSVGRVVRRLGYDWVLLDEIACAGQHGRCDFTTVRPVTGITGLTAVFRERRASNLIMSAVVRSGESLQQALGPEMLSRRYLVTAMDAETFGHHRPGLTEFLLAVLRHPPCELATVSEVVHRFPLGAPLEPTPSTWASSEQDIERGVQFLSWRDPTNPIHRAQWQFFRFVLRQFSALSAHHSKWPKIRARLDRAEASDHFWWASAKPWWSLEMIEAGAWQLHELLVAMPHVSADDKDRGDLYYRRILDLAFYWQRSGLVRRLAEQARGFVKIPFRERTVEAGKPEVYDAFIHFMRERMREAAEREEYEKAILWRDAVWRLETKNDIYEAVHAVNLLRQEVPPGALENLMDRYKAAYQRLRSGQPEDRWDITAKAHGVSIS